MSQYDDLPIFHKYIGTDNDVLHIPFAINIKELDTQQIDALLDQCEAALGAAYFRTKSLLKEVIADRVQATKKWSNFLYGPYITVTIKPDQTRRLSAMDSVPGGFTVYAHDQITELLNGVQRMQAEQVELKVEETQFDRSVGSPALKNKY